MYHSEVLTELKNFNVYVLYSNKAIKPFSTLFSVCFPAQETLLFLPYIRRESKFEFIISLLHKKPVSPQLRRESRSVPLFPQLQDGWFEQTGRRRELGNAPAGGLHRVPPAAVLCHGAAELQGCGSRHTLTIHPQNLTHWSLA